MKPIVFFCLQFFETSTEVTLFTESKADFTLTSQLPQVIPVT
jgi:hypothetical protein